MTRRSTVCCAGRRHLPGAAAVAGEACEAANAVTRVEQRTVRLASSGRLVGPGFSLALSCSPLACDR
jgi:hypothetical protein